MSCTNGITLESKQAAEVLSYITVRIRATIIQVGENLTQEKRNPTYSILIIILTLTEFFGITVAETYLSAHT